MNMHEGAREGWVKLLFIFMSKPMCRTLIKRIRMHIIMTLISGTSGPMT